MSTTFKDKTYRLIGDSFQLAFVLKSGKNKKLTIFDDSDKNTAKHRNRAIRYCSNESTIFIDEQSEHAVVAPIIFENKLFEVKGTDLALQKFLSVHPSNTANGGATFEELNPEVEAAQELEYEEMVLDIKSAIRKKEKEEDGIYELQALAGVLLGSASLVKTMGMAALKREIYNVVDSNPTRFTDDNGNVNIFDNSEITRKYIVLKAINEGTIIVSGDLRSVQWGDSKTSILSVPRSVSAVDHFTQFLETDEGLVVLKEIEKRSK